MSRHASAVVHKTAKEVHSKVMKSLWCLAGRINPQRPDSGSHPVNPQLDHRHVEMVQQIRLLVCDITAHKILIWEKNGFQKLWGVWGDGEGGGGVWNSNRPPPLVSPIAQVM